MLMLGPEAGIDPRMGMPVAQKFLRSQPDIEVLAPRLAAFQPQPVSLLLDLLLSRFVNGDIRMLHASEMLADLPPHRSANVVGCCAFLVGDRPVRRSSRDKFRAAQGKIGLAENWPAH